MSPSVLYKDQQYIKIKMKGEKLGEGFRLAVYASLSALSVILYGCLDECDECLETEIPQGYVVRMKQDYSGNVMVNMYVNGDDTTFCCPSVGEHTERISEDYYNIRFHAYDLAAYLSIKSAEWNDSIDMDSVSTYLADADPYDEVYAYYSNYNIETLKTMISNNIFNEMRRLR